MDKFRLTSDEMDREPIDEFFTNLFILGHIEKKQELKNKHGNS